MLESDCIAENVEELPTLEYNPVLLTLYSCLDISLSCCFKLCLEPQELGCSLHQSPVSRTACRLGFCAQDSGILPRPVSPENAVRLHNCISLPELVFCFKSWTEIY